MVTPHKLKRLGMKVLDKSQLTEEDIAEVVEALFLAAEYLEYSDESITIRDSQISLSRELSKTWKTANTECLIELEEAKAINDELRRQNKMLKEALYN